MNYIMTNKYHIRCIYYIDTKTGNCNYFNSTNYINGGISPLRNYCKGCGCIYKLTTANQNDLELIIKIENNDIAWAVQNLQSNNINYKVVAKYIVDNYKTV